MKGFTPDLLRFDPLVLNRRLRSQIILKLSIKWIAQAVHVFESHLLRARSLLNVSSPPQMVGMGPQINTSELTAQQFSQVLF